MRVWMLLAAAVATVAVTKSFGLKVNGDALHGVERERFEAWYGSAMNDMASDEVIEEYVADFDRLEEQLDDVTENRDTLPIHRWVVEGVKTKKSKRIALDRLSLDNANSVVPIEVYTPDSVATGFDNFINKLIYGEEVRIAFLGDSFVEGDILTSDLREALQAKFGGRGVGFVHCEIPFSTARRTVTRKASNWNAYSVLKPKGNPQAINDNFFVSGYTARGSKGAKVSWQSEAKFNHLDSCTRARIFLSTESGGSVKVTINADTTLCRRFDLVETTLPQEIYIEAGVDRLDMEVVDGVVECYGASIEGVGGVILDNFSMRANSGHAIFGTSAVVNRQIDTYVDYDLVVLQYGLNIMEAGKYNFSAYAKKLQQMIAYAQSSFPNAAVLVLGVSDRWVKNEESGVYQPIGSVDAMTSYQRSAAESMGVAFWPTATAMANYGGMPQFVENGWAAKDYTHINFAGGAQLGRELYRSIVAYAYDHLASGEAVAPHIIDVAKPIEMGELPSSIKPIIKPISQPSPVSTPEPSDQPEVEDSSLAEPVKSEETIVEDQTSEVVVTDEPMAGGDVEVLDLEQDIEPEVESEGETGEEAVELDSSLSVDIDVEVDMQSSSESVDTPESVASQTESHDVDVMDEEEFFETT